MTITWHTHRDERTCLRCGVMDGFTWIYHTAKQGFPDYLPHGMWGAVWDCRRDVPLIHGENSRRGPWNCRCWLTWVLDVEDTTGRLSTLNESLGGMMEQLRGRMP